MLDEQSAGGATALPRAGFAGAFGNAVEWYDFAVLGSSATLVAQALTPGSAKGGVTAVFVVFAVAFLVRPLGAVLGARWADRAGRRRPLLAAWFAMSVATAAIGLLPTWEAAGASTLIALMVMRVLQGVSAGAELVVSVAYLVELAPTGQRGRWGGLHMATIALGFAGGTAAVATVSSVLSEEALASWGWRLPFLAALPLGALAFALRRRVLESPEYQALAGNAAAVWTNPLKALRPELAAATRGFLLAGGFMASFTLWFVYLPVHLSTNRSTPLEDALTAATGGLVALGASAVCFGHLSDVVGRRAVILPGLATVAVGWLVAYPAVERGSMAQLAWASVAMGVGLGAVVMQSTLAESFPPPLRAAGIATTAGMASAIVGSTAPLLAERFVGFGPGWIALYAIAWLGLAGWATLALTRPVEAAARP